MNAVYSLAQLGVKYLARKFNSTAAAFFPWETLPDCLSLASWSCVAGRTTCWKRLPLGFYNARVFSAHTFTTLGVSVHTFTMLGVSLHTHLQRQAFYSTQIQNDKGFIVHKFTTLMVLPYTDLVIYSVMGFTAHTFTTLGFLPYTDLQRYGVYCTHIYNARNFTAHTFTTLGVLPCTHAQLQGFYHTHIYNARGFTVHIFTTLGVLLYTDLQHQGFHCTQIYNARVFTAHTFTTPDLWSNGWGYLQSLHTFRTILKTFLLLLLLLLCFSTITYLLSFPLRASIFFRFTCINIREHNIKKTILSLFVLVC